MRKSRTVAVAFAAVVFAILLGCQTAVPVPFAPTESWIQVESSGLAPVGGTGHSTIEISLLFGNRNVIKKWKVEIVGAKDKVVQKSWSGDENYLPASLTWGGRTDAWDLAPEGTYVARLSIEFDPRPPVLMESRSFVLVTTPPTGTISLDPPQFVPSDEGVTGPVTLTINASSPLARMNDWWLHVYDQDGGLVKSFNGAWPDDSVSWDGSSLNGGYVSPATTYRAVATVRDEYGNSAQLMADVPVADLPMAKEKITPDVQGRLSITAKSAGFSPNGDQIADAMSFALFYGQPSAVASWKVTISSPRHGVQKTFTGSGSSLPATLTWVGKTDSERAAPEGTYTATLAIDYGSSFNPATAVSAPFVLDLTPPTASIALSSPLFNPVEASDTITLTLSASSPVAKIDSWTMDIYDPEGNLFRSFTDKWPANKAVWDGKGIGGLGFVLSAEEYPVVAKVRDQFGNVGQAKITVPIDILVERTASGFRILASRIFFKAFTADYTNVGLKLAAQNRARLNALTEKLKKFPGYEVKIVGHAVSVYWDVPALGKTEQDEILIPLSKARAEVVRIALVERGLSAAMFTTDGVGASDQLVPDSDYKYRWQNRRVAFFIEKK